jgi:acyl-CoA synthetase (AMP-forming)/AMP-acid ligase II
MSHIGVHTTAILPAIFKAKEVSFVKTGQQWTEAVVNATHIQFFYTMLEYYEFPEQHKIKTATTGGDFLMPNLVTKLLDSGVERIVDIYGLTEAAPPLAIREIRSLDDLSKPFKWVNDAYQCYIEDSLATVIRPDGVHWRANDLARYDHETKDFYYIGRHGSGARIRMQGILFDTFDFRKLEQATSISNYFVNTTTDIPKLLVTQKDQVVAEKFIKDFEVTIDLVITDNFRTSGGIKNTL